MIPLTGCKARTVYELHSRNLRYGVFDGETGFIGIRIKFDSRFLFKEYHYDTGPPYGTVHVLPEVTTILQDIDLVEGYRPGEGDNPLGSGYIKENHKLFDLLERIEQEQAEKFARACPVCGQRLPTFYSVPGKRYVAAHKRDSVWCDGGHREIEEEGFV